MSGRGSLYLMIFSLELLSDSLFSDLTDTLQACIHEKTVYLEIGCVVTVDIPLQ